MNAGTAEGGFPPIIYEGYVVTRNKVRLHVLLTITHALPGPEALVGLLKC